MPSRRRRSIGGSALPQLFVDKPKDHEVFLGVVNDGLDQQNQKSTIIVTAGFQQRLVRLDPVLFGLNEFGGQLQQCYQNRKVQVLMPLLGWQIGIEMQPMIKSIDHWLAFGILSAIGGKMIFEGLRESEKGYGSSAFTISALILTAIATSIDSLIVGFGFGFLNISVLVALMMIGSVTFLTSFGGVFLGKRLSTHVGEYAEIVAGLVLIVLGAKILLDHTQFLGG